MKAARKKSREARRPPPASSLHGRLAAWLVPALVASLTFVAFLPALQNGFVNWDDDQNIVANAAYRGLGSSELRWMFTTFHLGHYQPLSWMSLAFDYHFWGLNPFGYHLSNVVIHSAAAVLFYFVALRLLRLSFTAEGDFARFSAAFAALFFSLHPLRVESVAWVTERRDVLSGVFLLAAVLLYLRAAAEDAQGGRRWLIGAVVFYAASLLSKASGMALPVVLVTLDVYPLRRLPSSPRQWFAGRYRAIWVEKILFLLLAIPAAAVALTAQKASGAYVSMEAYGIERRIGQTLYALYFYIWKTILPLHLSPLYQVPFRTEGWSGVLAASVVGVGALTLLLLWKRKSVPALFAAWISYVAFVAPIAGVAQSGVQLVADRYSYLSCLSWAVLAGVAFYKIYFMSGKHYLVSALASAGLILLGVGTWRQTEVWRDSGTLWRHAVAVAPESSVVRYNLGLVEESSGNFAGAMENYQEAIALDPADAEARYNLARLLARGGKTDEAIAEYRKAAAVAPGDADTHNNLGLLLLKRGVFDEARRELELTLAIDPSHARAHYNLGKLLASAGRPDEAIAHFRRALEKEPAVAEIHENLARALAQQGKKEEAMREYEEAVRIMKGGK
jgi:tetratricopeptide (TPR) repeat protein